MTDYRLICGDALEVLSRLFSEEVRVDMVFCSPNPFLFLRRGLLPRNVGSERNVHEYLAHLGMIFLKVRAVLKDTGSLWVHLSDAHMTASGSMIQIPERFGLMMVEKYGWLLRGKRIWMRGSHEIAREGLKIFPWNWEPVLWFTKTKRYTWNDDKMCAFTSVIDAPYLGPREDGGSGFPYKVIDDAIYTTTRPGDTVMDCFMGTGETGVAALRLGRKFIGIDLRNENVLLAQRRLRSVS